MSGIAAPAWLVGRVSVMSREDMLTAIEYLDRHARAKAVLAGEDKPSDDTAKETDVTDPAKLAARVRAAMGPVS